MIKSASNQTPVVYGEWGDNAVFLLEDEATERHQLFQGLADSRTWGELEKAISQDRYAEISELVSGRDDYGHWLSFEDFYLRHPSDSRTAACVEEEKMARKAYDSIGLGQERPGAQEPFNEDMIRGIRDGDWPEWPAQEMLHWVPESVQIFGNVRDSCLNGDFLWLDWEKEAEIVTAMADAGYSCRRDDELIEAAHGC